MEQKLIFCDKCGKGGLEASTENGVSTVYGPDKTNLNFVDQRLQELVVYRGSKIVCDSCKEETQAFYAQLIIDTQKKIDDFWNAKK